MKHFVYKTTNLVNGKYYIGKRSAPTLSGTYLGSGTAFKAALKKYGKENFKREILKEFNSSEEAYCYEAKLVGPEEVLSRICYNLRVGGIGHPSTIKPTPFLLKGVQYDSVQEAAAILGVHETTIRRRLKGAKEISSRSVPVIIENTYYPSVRQASRVLGIHPSTIKYRLESSYFLNYNYKT